MFSPACPHESTSTSLQAQGLFNHKNSLTSGKKSAIARVFTVSITPTPPRSFAYLASPRAHASSRSASAFVGRRPRRYNQPHARSAAATTPPGFFCQARFHRRTPGVIHGGWYAVNRYVGRRLSQHICLPVWAKDSSNQQLAAVSVPAQRFFRG